jgi:hypothetical protein
LRVGLKRGEQTRYARQPKKKQQWFFHAGNYVPVFLQAGHAAQAQDVLRGFVLVVFHIV